MTPLLTLLGYLSFLWLINRQLSNTWAVVQHEGGHMDHQQLPICWIFGASTAPKMPVQGNYTFLWYRNWKPVLLFSWMVFYIDKVLFHLLKPRCNTGWLLYPLCRYKGTVFDMIEDTSSMSVHFDDGRSRTLELGKQGVRFISQKQKHDGTWNQVGHVVMFWARESSFYCTQKPQELEALCSAISCQLSPLEHSWLVKASVLYSTKQVRCKQGLFFYR